MHSYLRAIGFSKVKNRSDLDKVLGIVMENPTEKRSFKINEKETIVEYRKDFGERIGVIIRGIYDEKGFYHLEHYFPYLMGQSITAKEDVIINKRIDSDAYTGMCEDFRVGVSLIFYLQNAMDYMQVKSMEKESRILPVTLTALSVRGRILLGIEGHEDDDESKNIRIHKKSQMIAEAMAGNQEAIENLTIEEIDTCSMIQRRIKKEDVYSIVESTFIPYGSESDNYTILGTILSWKIAVNEMTRENVYELLVDCNDIRYSICINEGDLEGKPMVGRRFKGIIWMQGKVHFK